MSEFGTNRPATLETSALSEELTLLLENKYLLAIKMNK
ncbi:hypothetical protein Rahaq_1642 [Rahnella aceris]|jgi:hypothetical protein|uniref:Uncharacterized protein n=1 Tax=Rahnella sp. (strain Y9602) TaxID=2703885 RepID=A0A0H3FE27_RAHSY|nr:hypothetical protein Rahaq_1642 [Rahnella aceris]MDP9704254.1 hypothetical protein [Rahnella aquatilis]CAH0326554.1 hypothetical protein SRABI106_04696 [Rahnella aquatilis]